MKSVLYEITEFQGFTRVVFREKNSNLTLQYQTWAINHIKILKYNFYKLREKIAHWGNKHFDVLLQYLLK